MIFVFVQKKIDFLTVKIKSQLIFVLTQYFTSNRINHWHPQMSVITGIQP